MACLGENAGKREERLEVPGVLEECRWEKTPGRGRLLVLLWLVDLSQTSKERK
jgi:hypothetical protein